MAASGAVPENEKKITSFKKVESQIESKISKVGTDREFYEHNADCPTCRQAITLEFKEGQLTELTTKEQELRNGLVELQTKISAHETQLRIMREDEKRLSNVRVQIATTNTSVKGLNDTIKRLEKEIKELRTPKVNDTDTNELETIQTQITQAQEELKQLISDKTYLDVASTLLKDTGIKTNIIKQYLPVINKLANKYLTSMDFFVNFNVS